MTEHLNAYQLTTGTYNMLFLNITTYLTDLIHVEFSSQNYHIRILCIKLQGFRIAHIELGRQMHFHTDIPTILQDSHITGYDSRYSCLKGCITYLPHQVQVFWIHNGIDSQITLYMVFVAFLCNHFQVTTREMRRRMCTHIQTFHAEIYSIGTSLYCRIQTFP